MKKIQKINQTVAFSYPTFELFLNNSQRGYGNFLDD